MFGGFQIGPFQSNFQQGSLLIFPGPSVIKFLPASSNNQVPELSDYYASITYLDINGNPYTPLVVAWRLWDDTNKVLLQDWTTIPIPGISNQIDIPAAMNALGNSANLQESRILTFRIAASGGALRYDSGFYNIIGFPDIP